MWLITHIIFGLGGFLFLFAATIKIIFHSEENSTDSQSSIPPSKSPDNLLEWGWILYTISIILGSFQAKEQYGSYWVWDLKEILSLATTCAYFLYLCINQKLSPKMKRITIIFCGTLIITTFLIPNFVLSYHQMG